MLAPYTHGSGPCLFELVAGGQPKSHPLLSVLMLLPQYLRMSRAPSGQVYKLVHKLYLRATAVCGLLSL